MLVVLLTFALKFELVNDVTEAVSLAVLEVRHEFLNVEVVLQERSSRGEVEVADDLVDGDFAFDVATFVRHFVNAFGPVFGGALRRARFQSGLRQARAESAYLFDGVGVAEAPTAVKISLSHILASLAASRVWWETAVAGTAIAVSALSSQAIQLSLELCKDTSRVNLGSQPAIG